MAISGVVVEDHHLLLFKLLIFVVGGLDTEVVKDKQYCCQREKDRETINRMVKHNDSECISV